MSDTPTPRLDDLLIIHGTLITMDPERRVLDDGALAIDGDRIVAVGSSADVTARFVGRKTINAHRKAVLPGLIDCHAHAGHGISIVASVNNQALHSV